MFAALHEPFTGGLAGRVDRKYEALARTDNALAVLVTGKDCNDRILMAHGEDVAQKQKLSAGKESYAFTGYAFVRVGAEHVEAVGHLQACTIPVTGSPKFTLNGKDTPIIMTDHCLVYRSE
jgi:hypothetical protein